MKAACKGIAPPSASRRRALTGAIMSGALTGADLGLRREYFSQEEADVA